MKDISVRFSCNYFITTVFGMKTPENQEEPILKIKSQSKFSSFLCQIVSSLLILKNIMQDTRVKGNIYFFFVMLI